MASSNPEVKKPGSSGSLLAPSKFGANFGRNDPKRLFTGLKASKLTSITQSVCNSSAVAVTQQSQQTSTSPVASATTAPSSKPFVEQIEQNQASSSCTPVISKVTLNVSSTPSISPQKKETTESPPDGKNDEPAGFLFGQNLADRAENFADAQSTQASSGANATAISTDASKVNPQSSPPGFLFGENLADRVTTNDAPGKKLTETSGEKEKTADTSLEKAESSNLDLSSSKQGTTDLETNANETSSSPAKDKAIASSKALPEQTPTSGRTLHENAAEYFESHLAPPKRKYDEVEVITGEENEHNVLHMSAKLHIFDKSKTWLERGRGELRLNDLSVAAANATSSPTTCLTGSQAR